MPRLRMIVFAVALLVVQIVASSRGPPPFVGANRFGASSNASSFIGTLGFQQELLNQVAQLLPPIVGAQLQGLHGSGFTCGSQGCNNYVTFGSWAGSSAVVSNPSLIPSSSGTAVTFSASVTLNIAVAGLTGYSKHSSCHWCGCWLCGSYCSTNYNCGGPGSVTATYDVSMDIAVSSSGSAQTPSSVSTTGLSYASSLGSCTALCGGCGGCQAAVSGALSPMLTDPTSYSNLVASLNVLLGIVSGVQGAGVSSSALILASGATSSALPAPSAFPISQVGVTASVVTVQKIGGPLRSACNVIVCPLSELVLTYPLSAKLTFTACAGCVATIENEGYFALIAAASLMHTQ